MTRGPIILLLAAGLLLAGALGWAGYTVVQDRDRAWAGMQAALAEAAEVRADAVVDRRAMRARVDRILDDTDELREETRLLRRQVEVLQAQVLELGGEPIVGPPDRQQGGGSSQEQERPGRSPDREPEDQPDAPDPEPDPADPGPEPPPDDEDDDGLLDGLLPDLPTHAPARKGRP